MHYQRNLGVLVINENFSKTGVVSSRQMNSGNQYYDEIEQYKLWDRLYLCELLKVAATKIVNGLMLRSFCGNTLY